MSSVAGPKGGGVGGHAKAHNRLTPNLVQRNKETDGQMENLSHPLGLAIRKKVENKFTYPKLT